MEKFKLTTSSPSDGSRRGSALPVNGSIRLPNGQSFRYVRSDIMRDVIDRVTHGDRSPAK